MSFKRTKLKMYWSKSKGDFWFSYPGTKDDYYLLAHTFFATYIDTDGNSPSFLKELEQRGYDPTTLKFEIRKKKEKNHG